MQKWVAANERLFRLHLKFYRAVRQTEFRHTLYLVRKYYKSAKAGFESTSAFDKLSMRFQVQPLSVKTIRY